MKAIVNSELTQFQKKQVLDLWNKEYPIELAYKDIEAFDDFLLKMGKANHKLLLDGERIVGWLATFDRENERWFSIIVDSSQQGKGIGKKLVEMAMNEEYHLCGWVVDHEEYKRADGAPYISPITFYIKMGFEVLTEERYKGEKLDAVKIYWKK